MKKVLLLIDPQNDFCDKKGSLYVPGGEEVIPVANRLMTSNKFHCIASQDWHGADHKSFASNSKKKIGEIFDLNGLSQVAWPDHCIANSWGSDFHKNLLTGKLATIFRKGMDKEVDSYSAFVDNGKRNKTGLGGYLKELDVKDLYIACVATDYCVKFSVLDALELGFKVSLITDGCKAVNLKAGDDKAAIDEMVKYGAGLTTSTELLK